MSDLQIPESWISCKLGDVVNYGSTRKAEPHEIPEDAWVLELEDVEKDSSRILQRLTFGERQSKSTKNHFATGDVLYGKLRPYLNKVVRADSDGFCTTEIIPLKPSENLDGGFLFHWLKHPAFLEYVTAVSHGLNMPRLGTEAGKDAPFVLAPINEQKRIADKLDTILARVDACRERLDRVPAILKRFRQAVLEAATTGKLTEDWRRDTGGGQEEGYSTFTDRLKLPESWSWSSPDEIRSSDRYSLAIGPFGSNLKVSDYRDSGVPLVFVREIRSKSFGGQKTKFVSPEKSQELTAHWVSAGDLLITKMGDPPGDTAIYPSGVPDAIITADCIKLRVDELKADPIFVGYVIESPYFREQLIDITAGVAQQKISLERFRKFPIQLAPISEQKEIVRRVQSLFAFADALEARHTAARAQVDRLALALHAKAFRGELVPQNAEDEPASMLLERIRIARDLETAKPKHRKVVREKHMNKLTTEAILEIIQQLPSDRFTFEELRREIPVHYEELKDAIFALLANPKSGLKQIFDVKEGAMRFERVKP